MRGNIERDSLWSKDFVLANCSKTFSSLAFVLLTTITAPYAFASFDSSASEAGIAVGMFIFAAMISRAFAGRYMEVIGRRRMLLCGSGLYFAAMMGYLLPAGYEGLLAVRFVHGVGFGIATNALTVAVTKFIPKAHWAQGLGIFQMSATVATAIAPYIGLSLIQRVSFRAAFLFCIFCGLGAFLSALFMHVENLELSEKERSEITHGFTADQFVDLSALPMSILVAIITGCYAVINSFVSVFATDSGIGYAGGWYFIVFAAVLFAARPLSGKIHDSQGENAVLYPSLLLYALGLFVLGANWGVAGLLLAAVIIGVGYGGIFTSSQAIIINAADERRMGVATSTFYVFGDLGMGVGPALLGLAEPYIGYGGMYWACAFIALSCFAFYHLSHGKKVRRAKSC